MIFLLALVSSGLASPIDKYEAKNAELRALLESGGPADITGSWTPKLTPEVKAATKFFIGQYNTVELGGLEQLQAKQIPNAYIADTLEVAAAKEAFQATFMAAEMGKHAEIVPVNNDLQAGQIANAYIDDTEDVAVAKAAHMTAVEEAAAAAMEPTEDPAFEEIPLLMPRVHPQQAESYLCTSIRVDTDAAYSITGFRPNATKMTAHHMLIYGCEEPGAESPTWNCGEMAVKEPGMVSAKPCAKGSQIIYGWAMDAKSLELPKGVGFRVGRDSAVKYLVLQVHYASVDHIPQEGDDSGVFLQYTEQEMPRTAGVLLMAVGRGGTAPPHSTTYFETACEIEDQREIHPFAFRTHTHSLGRVVSGWRVRNNQDWTLIGKKSPQVPQTFYPVETDLTLSAGDVVAARCTMVNTRNRTTMVGPTAEDEMCNFYMMYWVEGKDTIEPNTCFTRGPPTWSWGGLGSLGLGADLGNIPDLEASVL